MKNFIEALDAKTDAAIVAAIDQEAKNRALKETSRVMMSESYEVTKARRAEEVQEQAAAIRNKGRPERYSIEDAIILMIDETDDYFQMLKAVESGDIPCYKHGTGDKKGDPNDLRSYVCWDDLNKWIEEKTNIREFRFPSLAAPAAKGKAKQGTSSSGDDKPWLVHNPKDPEPDFPWYIPARYFARELVKDDSTLLVKKAALAKKTVESLAGAGIFKRGKKKESLSSGTVLKSFVNVILS